VSTPDELDRFIEAQGDRFIAELRELCAIPCEAADRAALDAAARWCRDRMRAAGFGDARELRTDGAPALVVGETGSGRRTLLGVQHYDVQPAVPLELWRTPPYVPAVRDGAVYARGVDDNKGHLLLRIQAVEAHRAVLGELPPRQCLDLGDGRLALPGPAGRGRGAGSRGRAHASQHAIQV